MERVCQCCGGIKEEETEIEMEIKTEIDLNEVVGDKGRKTRSATDGTCFTVMISKCWKINWVKIENFCVKIDRIRTLAT